MFIHRIEARLKIAVRSKKYLFWTLLFPLALGTLFYFAFSSIYSSETTEPIPVYVQSSDSALEEYKVLQAFSLMDTDRMQDDLEKYYMEKATAEAMGEDFTKEPPISEDKQKALEKIENYDDIAGTPLDVFDNDYMTGTVDSIDASDLPLVNVLESLEYEDGTKMVEMVSCKDMDEAQKLLKDGDLAGIITIDGLRDVELLVNGEGVNHSILSSIISEYLLQVDLTIDQINEKPEKSEDIDSAIDNTTFNLDYIQVHNADGDTKDPFITYFYNLIAMVCLMGSMASLSSVVNTQANQEATGLRIDVSPVNKSLLELADLVAITLIQFVIIIITLTYLIFGLKLKFGGSIPLIYLTSILSSTVGTTLGFMVGHIGSFKQELKEVILMAIFLGGGFMSGLMYGDMKMIMENKCPLFNRLNPASVITDAFISLNLYGGGKNYYRSLMYIFIVDIIMLVVGLMLSRRKSYKSL